MKTKADCPTCNAPFSFWRIVIGNPFALYCMSCGQRNDIGRAKTFMWGMLAGILLITFILAQFIIPRDFTRLLILGILWVAGIVVLDIIISLMMVNWAQLSKPEESDKDVADQPVQNSERGSASKDTSGEQEGNRSYVR